MLGRFFLMIMPLFSSFMIKCIFLSHLEITSIVLSWDIIIHSHLRVLLPSFAIVFFVLRAAFSTS